MESILCFDANPKIYWLIGYLIAFGIGLYITLKQNPKVSIFLLASLCMLLYMRLPIVLFNREIDVDESQMLTQAITLLKDPVYWHSVDGTTGGPLGSYFLILPYLVIGKFNYIASHLGSVTLVSITLICIFKSLQNLFNKKTALLVSYPIILFYSFTQYNDFVHYSSEHLPVTLLGFTLYLLSNKKLLGNNFLYIIALAILSFAVPFGKIQSLPLLFVNLVYLLYLFIKNRSSKHFIIFTATYSICWIIFISILYYANIFDDFINFYIKANFTYRNENQSWLSNIIILPYQYRFSVDFLLLLAPLIVVLLISVHTIKLFNHLLIFAVFYFIFGILAITRTGSGYPHYLLFMIIPTGLLLGIFYNNINPIKIYLPVSFISFCYMILIGLSLYHFKENKALNKFSTVNHTNQNLPFTVTGLEIMNYKKPGDYLAVWGWNCQYYVETQMPQGACENHTIRSIFNHESRKDYRDRYIKDLKENKPAIIVDAVGPNSCWVQDTATQGCMSFPELRNYIKAKYQLVSTKDNNKLYVRKDRLPTNNDFYSLEH
ncbi:MAG: hypothetical protein QM669_12080 [Siphonobacter sp.]